MADRPLPTFAEIMPRLTSLLSPFNPALRLRSILVPVDFTESSLRSLPYALFFAQQFGCSVTLLHVVYLNIAREERGVPLTRLLEEMKSAAERVLHQIAASLNPASAKVVVRIGKPVAEILAEVTEADVDLIVIGRHRRNPILRFFSPSIGGRIISRAPCPSLVTS
jgi:nucleotide-binding universal stress UspA family protein